MCTSAVFSLKDILSPEATSRSPSLRLYLFNRNNAVSSTVLYQTSIFHPPSLLYTSPPSFFPLYVIVSQWNPPPADSIVSPPLPAEGYKAYRPSLSFQILSRWRTCSERGWTYPPSTQRLCGFCSGPLTQRGYTSVLIKLNDTGKLLGANANTMHLPN